MCDLALIDYALSTRAASSAVIRLKAHPTFVSDAMVKDVHHTINFLAGCGGTARALAARLRDHLTGGRLRLTSLDFWTSPLEGWRMPPVTRRALSEAMLVVSKGDAHYRRLLGDRHWPPTTPFADIACYFPAPVVALRTCKSEVAVGLEPGQVEWVAAQDADWLVDGRWGMVQFAIPEQWQSPQY